MYVVGSMVLFIKSRARRHEANRPDAADEDHVAHILQILHKLHGHCHVTPVDRKYFKDCTRTLMAEYADLLHSSSASFSILQVHLFKVLRRRTIPAGAPFTAVSPAGCTPSSSLSYTSAVSKPIHGLDFLSARVRPHFRFGSEI
jgi:hypothetical protein